MLNVHKQVTRSINQTDKLKFGYCPPSKTSEYHRVYMREWRKKHPEKIKAYTQKPTAKLKKKIANHLWYIENREKKQTQGKVWNALHRDIRRSYSKRWQTANRYKHAIHARTIRNVPLADKCEFCGTTKNLVRHHPDYSEPLIVITCCQSCHCYIHLDERIPTHQGGF